MYQLWNDDTGSRVEVCEDPDGLGLVEISSNSEYHVGEPQRMVTHISLPVEAARMLAENILKLCDTTQRAREFDATKASQELSTRYPYIPHSDILSAVELARENVLRDGGKIQAIKTIRNATGMLLKEAKDFVEKYLV